MSFSRIDLHCHSLASDGDLSPAAVVERAHEKGVEVLSLTDHDTLDGQLEASAKAAELGMHYVTGIELSCVWGGHTIHVLGLNMDLSAPSIIELASNQQKARVERAEIIDARLRKQGLGRTLELAYGFSEEGPPGRPHFAKALISLGEVNDFQSAFKKYLGAGKVGDVKVCWPDLATVIGCIRKSGGKAVIAHPRKYNMTLTKLRNLIESFKLLGGHGLEVVVAGQKQGEIGLLADLCMRYQLEASLGSDFHSPSFPWADFGTIPPLPKSVKAIWSDWSFAPILKA